MKIEDLRQALRNATAEPTYMPPTFEQRKAKLKQYMSEVMGLDISLERPHSRRETPMEEVRALHKQANQFLNGEPAIDIDHAVVDDMQFTDVILDMIENCKAPPELGAVGKVLDDRRDWKRLHFPKTKRDLSSATPALDELVPSWRKELDSIVAEAEAEDRDEPSCPECEDSGITVRFEDGMATYTANLFCDCKKGKELQHKALTDDVEETKKMLEHDLGKRLAASRRVTERPCMRCGGTGTDPRTGVIAACRTCEGKGRV